MLLTWRDSVRFRAAPLASQRKEDEPSTRYRYDLANLFILYRSSGSVDSSVFTRPNYLLDGRIRQNRILTKKVLTQMGKPDIISEQCSCHERDSSFVCEVCYKRGYRGHMQESSSHECDDCCLWSDSHTCDFCGKAI